MKRILSKLDTGSTDFQSYKAHNEKIVGQFKEKQHAARYERPARDIERLAKQNKMMPRERLELLLDPGTLFLELSSQ